MRVLPRDARDISVPYDPGQLALYRCRDKACTYYSVLWPLNEGRGKWGEFPLVVVREHYRSQG
jgi:hypothetical protein